MMILMQHAVRAYTPGRQGRMLRSHKRLHTFLALVACNLDMIQDVAQAVWTRLCKCVTRCNPLVHVTLQVAIQNTSGRALFHCPDNVSWNWYKTNCKLPTWSSQWFLESFVVKNIQVAILFHFLWCTVSFFFHEYNFQVPRTHRKWHSKPIVLQTFTATHWHKHKPCGTYELKAETLNPEGQFMRLICYHLLKLSVVSMQHGLGVLWRIAWSLEVVMMGHTQWASYQIRKIAGCACAGNAGNVFPATAS